MALIPLSYCNGSLGKNYSFNYNDATHAIQDVVEGSSCGPGGYPSDIQLYQHTQGSTTYYVKTKNTFPYAYVTSVTSPPCSVVIDSINIGNASNSASSDGTIEIIASGPYAKQYSINNGSSYQASNIFTGLAPGTYQIRVRSEFPTGTFCVDTDTAEVGYNALVCELELGNITTEEPSTPGGSDGTITVNTLTNPPGLQVEYRLDAGAWQDSPIFTGLSAGTYNVQVRYKDFTSCSDNRDVEVQDGVTCDIAITHVAITHEQSKFADDGSIEIIASSSNGTIQYSINNGSSYQASNVFQDLAPGAYLIRVKDASDCEDTRTVVVEPYKTPYFDVPIANGLRGVITSGPGVDNTLQNFDNTLFRNMRFPGVEPGCYDMPRQFNDAEKIQWRSNYSNHTLRLYNADDDSEEDTISTEKVKDFTRQTESISAFLADAGSGKTQVFFENALPEWAKVGQDITLSDTGEVTLDGLTFEIQDITPGILDADGYVALIIDVAFPGSGIISGTVDVEYDIEPFDVHEATISWGDYAAGRYYLKLTATDDQFEDAVAEFEPVVVATTHEDTVLIRWSNVDNAFKIFYDTDVDFMMRVEGTLRRPQPGGTEVNHEESDGRFVKLYEQVTRNPELLIAEVPPYLAEKLAIACAHDSLVVNGVEYGKQDSKLEISYFDEELDALCNARIQLRQVEFIAENTDDAGDVDVPQTILGVNGVLYALNP